MTGGKHTGPPSPSPPPPIPAPLAAAVSRIAVAQICRSAGYHAAEPSALRALAEVSARYLLALARRAASAANACGRTDANLLDVAVALEELTLPRGFPGAADPSGRLLRSSAGTLKGLMHFVASVDEIPFARPVPRERAPGAPPGPKQTSQLQIEPPFPHVPRWLPGFPVASEGAQGKKCHTTVQKGGPLWERGLQQLPRPPSDGRWMEALEGARRLLPAERARVRFQLLPGAVKGDGGGEEGCRKKRKMELTSVMGKPLGKRMAVFKE